MTGIPKLETVVDWIAEGVRHPDATLPPYKHFAPGIGPYGEPQLCRELVRWLNEEPSVPFSHARTKRDPDILIPGYWAIEAKLARPFGDNGDEAEHWSQNLIHPYPGNVSSLGDALKLREWTGPERRAVLVFGFEHAEPRIGLDPLFRSFEIIAKGVLGLRLSVRVERRLEQLRHPFHAVCRVAGWQVDP